MSTRLMILGLLAHQSMTGYEIQQVLQQSGSDRWAGILSGSVYHALKKLQQEAFIEVQTIESTGNRQKARFAITAKGQEEVQTLVLQHLRTGSVAYPTTIYSAISFIDRVGREEAIAAIKENKQRLREEQQFMKHGQQAKKDVGFLTNEVAMIFDDIDQHIELQLALLQRLETYLKNQQ